MSREITDDPARADLLRGARLFDAGEHFEAHEVWEERWRSSTDELERRVFQGLIQVAAGLHKRFERNDVQSAARLLERGLAKLDACPDQVHGIDLGAFRARVRACIPALAHLERSDVPTIGA